MISLAVALCFLCWALIPVAQKVRDGEGWVYSANNLKQIDLALHNYHQVFKQFPPAVVRGQDGRPLYSWRVAILPYLDLERDDLLKEFKLDEPWDSPHNIKLLERRPMVYAPAWRDTKIPHGTHYQVFVGPGTLFEGPRPSLRDIPDGADQTLLVVEAAEPVPWSKPVDLTYDPKGPLPRLGGLFSKPTFFMGWESGRKPGFNAVFADGSMRFIGSFTEESILRTLITRNGGEHVDLSILD
jgi:hypothetical protein